MEAIAKFIKTWLDAICALIEFVLDFVGDIVHMVGVLGELAPAMPAFFTWLPPTLAGTLWTMVGFAILYRVLGWGD